LLSLPRSPAVGRSISHEEPVTCNRTLLCGEERGFPGAVLDLKRKDTIALAMPIDHSRDVLLTRYSDFNLSATIFGTIDSWVKQQYLSATMNVQPYWSDTSVRRIYASFLIVPPPPDVNRDLLNFMNTECNFAMEHADGSFLDHLKWGYEYGTKNYPSRSPTVLLLHSIMGVGTNYFPMSMDKVPTLQTFITDWEYSQIEVFPSMLRLLYADKMLPELTRVADYLPHLTGVTMHRVVDNKLLHLGADDFWAAMNYQLCHLVDFVPIANWNETFTGNDPFLVLFTKLLTFMRNTSRIEADVGLVPPVEGGYVGDNPDITFGSIINSITPSWFKWTLFTSSVKDLSKEIGHSLKYTLLWDDPSTCPRETGKKCMLGCKGSNVQCSQGQCVCKSGFCASDGACIEAASSAN